MKTSLLSKLSEPLNNLQKQEKAIATVKVQQNEKTHKRTYKPQKMEISH